MWTQAHLHASRNEVTKMQVAEESFPEVDRTGEVWQTRKVEPEAMRALIQEFVIDDNDQS
jgi:hypothetical protein